MFYFIELHRSMTLKILYCLFSHLWITLLLNWLGANHLRLGVPLMFSALDASLTIWLLESFCLTATTMLKWYFRAHSFWTQSPSLMMYFAYYACIFDKWESVVQIILIFIIENPCFLVFLHVFQLVWVSLNDLMLGKAIFLVYRGRN